MRIVLVTPGGVEGGNRVTALRWAKLLRSLGHTVRFRHDYQDEPCELLIALHAHKSAAAIERYRRRESGAPLVVALGGTDVYPEPSEVARRSMDLASRIVVLQPLLLQRLPAWVRKKAVVILQSAAPYRCPIEADGFQVCVIGHLRDVKEPFLAAEASRAVPERSRLKVLQVGAALDATHATSARAEERENPRYSWLGPLRRSDALAVLATSRLLVLTSRSEGGANVISEAIAASVPVLSTRIDAAESLLGADYPGLFPCGDGRALAELLWRAESDAAFYRSLSERIDARADIVSPSRERRCFSDLLSSLFPCRGRLAIRRVGTSVSDDFARDVREGLSAKPKRLHCRYFYDAEGSRLFEAICAQPEYYLPNAEREILERHAADIAALSGARELVELGSGSAVKTRLLIQALASRWRGRIRYVPIDISSSALDESARSLLEDFEHLEVVGVCGEYADGLKLLSRMGGPPRLIAFLGSNVGNFHRDEAVEFASKVRGAMRPADRWVLGVDLRKDRAVLERAYDDAAGVTAAFNKNLLVRINRELDGRFDVAAFDHRATYDVPDGRIDMWLVSRNRQTVHIGRLGIDVTFEAGEAVHTECSYKYSLEELDALASCAGLRYLARWTDSAHRFCLGVLAP